MHRTLAALGLWLAAAGAAHATTLSTGMLFGPSQTTTRPAGSTYCFVTNTGSRDVEVTVRILSDTGAVVDDRDVVVAGGGGSRATAAMNVNYARCEFAFAGSSKSIRASGCVAIDYENCRVSEPAR